MCANLTGGDCCGECEHRAFETKIAVGVALSVLVLFYMNTA